MANTKNFKVKNGIQPTAYHENVGTVTSGTGTVGFDISSASYDSKSFNASSQSGQMYGMFFKTDGTKMYLLEQTGSDQFYQYSLSTAWDISTVSYDNVSKPNGANGSPGGFYIKSDGLTLFMTGMASGGVVYKHTFGTAWDLSTLSYSGTSFSVNSQEGAPYDIWFKPDGTKMYIVGPVSDNIHEYDLSTAWDITTASFNQTFNPSIANPNGLYFTSDGTKMFVSGQTATDIFQFALSTAWDISSASQEYAFDVVAQDSAPYKVKFKSDGTKMYVLGASNDDVYQYTTEGSIATKTLDLSTGSVFEITPTSDIQISLSNPASSGTVSQATLLLDGASTGINIGDSSYASKNVITGAYTTYNQGMFLRPGGTDVYTSDTAGGYRIVRYSLSTAYDMSTATYTSQYTGHTGYELEVRGLYFKPDGLQMYVIGNSSDDVHQFTLSTAWDITTASFTRTRTLSDDSFPMDLTFKTDGTKFYVLGGSTNTIYEYDMSTAWDISTAGSSANRSYFGISSQSTSEQGLDFSADGTQMFYLASTNDTYQYTLSTAWDVSTASYDGIVFDGSGTFTDVGAISVRNSQDEGFMYISNSSGSASTAGVYQFNLGLTAPTITYDSSIKFAGGTAPDSPAVGDTDVLTFTTRDGGTTYTGLLAIDGAK